MSDSKQIDMEGRRLEPDFTFGCLRVTKGDKLPLSELFVERSARHAGVTFWGAARAPWDEPSLVSVQMYRLPRAKAAFEERLEWFARDRKNRAKLPDGQAFTLDTFALRSTPDGWEHDAFPRSSRDFIHVYRSKNTAVLIRWLGKSGTLLDHPLLKRLQAGLSIVEGPWVDDYPQAVSKSKKRTAIKDEPLVDGVLAQLQDAAARGAERLHLGRRRSPQKTVEAIAKFVDELHGSGGRIGGDPATDLAVSLGSLFGEALVKQTGWEWRQLTPARGKTGHYVCSPDRAFLVDPIGLFYALLTDPEQVDNSLLLFNMIVAANLPDAGAGGYLQLS